MSRAKTFHEPTPEPAQHPASGLAQSAPPTASTYAGLFFVTLATLMLEILLTRIFSVILWYHFAFVAVSVALFGMTLGAVIVHLAPRYFSGAGLALRLAGAAWLFGLTTAAAAAVMLTIRITPPGPGTGLAPLVPLYLLVAVPFTFSGIVVSATLTRFPQRVNLLYAADLIGAALGCAVVILALRVLDAPSATIAIGALAGLGALCFSVGSDSLAMRVGAGVLVVALTGFAFYNAHHALLRVRWAKGGPTAPPLYEKWNAFSRVAVTEYAAWSGGSDTGRADVPFGFYGTRVNRLYRVAQLGMDIDANARTVITHFDGKVKSIAYLRHDVTAAAHSLRPDSDVLVIGVGGGRDILTALATHQKSVTGIELNGDIVAALDDRFGDFSGHLDRVPRVRFITDEARSWIERSDRKFDIIQCSLIDTWAATAAGAFVLSENNLYTTQAWTAFLDHLTDRGVFTVTRWYFWPTPGETLRCLALARAALEHIGAHDARRHLAVLVMPFGKPTAGQRNGVSTILVSRSPFTDGDVRHIEQWARDNGFSLILSPRACAEPLFAQLLAARRERDFTDKFFLDVSAPTDDRPFFFHMLRPRDWAKPLAPGEQGMVAMNLRAISVLVRLLLTTGVLAVVFILVPLVLTNRRDRYSLRSLAPELLFFAAIGLGFMLVEISQMQRLIIFLGHPVYGLSVVLFALLGASGLGSLAVGGVSLDTGAALRRVAPLMAALLVLLAVFGVITPGLTQAARAWPMVQRILLATALLVPMAFLMGTPFPIGMKLVSRASRSPTAWYWGINGAMSVVASVGAMAVTLTAGITATFFAGVGCYLVAAVMLLLLARR